MLRIGSGSARLLRLGKPGVRPPEVMFPMHRRAVRLASLLLIAALLGGCDKCADNFLIDPFAKPKPASCHEAPTLK